MQPNLNRRDFLRWVGAGTAMISLPAVFGCRSGTALGVAGHGSGAHATYFDRFGVSEPVLGRVLAQALARGGDFADIYLQHTLSRTTGMQDGQVNRAFGSVDLGAGIRVLKGDATGFAYCEDLSEQALLAAAGTAAAVADGAPAAQPRSLAAVKIADFYRIEVPWSTIGIDRIVPIIERADREVRRQDARITKVGISVADEDTHILLANSEGRLVEDIRPMVLMVISCSARDGERIESSGDAISGRQGLELLSDANVDELVQEVVAQTVGGFEAVEAPSGDMPVVLAGGIAGVLLHEAIGHGMEADFNRKGTSIYADRIGQRIAGRDVTIIDDGTLPALRGSLNVDDEGAATQRTVLVENGILRSYMHDRISARHYQVAPTGSGRRQSFRFPPVPRMRTTYMISGPHDPQEIIASVKRGIYARVIGNGEVNIGAGDFSFYLIQGRLIENGKLTGLIKDVNLTGRGPQVLEAMDLIGNNMTLKTGGGSCGKDGQFVPVGFGMPTVRAGGISVGGRTA